MRKRIMFIIPLALLLVGGLAACGSDEEVVATVDGEEIYESEWQDTVDQMSMQYEQMGIDLDSEEGAQYLEMIEEQALESLIQQAAIVQSAAAEGISVDESDVDAEMEQITAQYPSEEEFHSALEDAEMDEESFRELLEEELIIDQYLDAQLDDVDVDQEDVEDFYDEYVEQTEAQGEEAEDFEDIEEELEMELIQQQEQEQIEGIVQAAMDSVEIERKL